ncbi:MAG TPA: Asp-tRNA(Asn)/Glu-tRNA(Gln) amidotransferase subunit GatC [bacterium]|nr:Asp-tRNA(Asn)/Glu-tRNA(Gln) amidotransferase subunit GatC [bacterium]HPN34818.1 Asp-tRNA(Asn)/Glu-tRNA(Gln) amidotransferase subunit GatC [bacterium]
MSVPLEEVDRIAGLAKLQFSADEKSKFAAQFNQIIQYIEKLAELDLTQVEPMSQVGVGINVFRDDCVQPSLTVEQVLANAPARKLDFFSVPKVIG